MLQKKKIFKPQSSRNQKKRHSIGSDYITEVFHNFFSTENESENKATFYKRRLNSLSEAPQPVPFSKPTFFVYGDESKNVSENNNLGQNHFVRKLIKVIFSSL